MSEKTRHKHGGPGGEPGDCQDCVRTDALGPKERCACDADGDADGGAPSSRDAAQAPGAPSCTLDGMGMKKANTLLHSFGYAAQGVKAASSERNFKVDCAAALVALALCAVLQVPVWGWVAVIVCIGMVLAAETANTAIEAVVDLASPELHPLAKRAKDCAAAVPLILAATSVVVACIVYGPALLALVQSR